MRAHHLTAIAAAAKGVYSFSPRAVAELQRHAILSTRSTQLLGDLVGDNNLTATGFQVSAILNGTDTAVGNNDVYQVPDAQDSQGCKDDECCKYSYAVKMMEQAFDGCNGLARQAIRLGFHDAAAWDSSLPNGGADGSVVLNEEESARFENSALQDIISQMKQWGAQLKQYDVSMADLIQLGAMTATVVCPGGPRIKAYMGRDDSDNLPPENLIPSPFAGAEENIALFKAKTFTATDLVALVGAHTVSQQKTVDPSRANAPQDTTDTVWDVTFYGETQSPNSPGGIVKFPSDVALSNNTETSATWTAFSKDQAGWNTAFAAAYFRMSLLGVKNINDLTDCTSVLPNPSGPGGDQGGGNQGGGSQGGGNQGGGNQGGGNQGGGNQGDGNGGGYQGGGNGNGNQGGGKDGGNRGGGNGGN